MANYGKRMVPEYLVKGLEEAYAKTSGGTGSTINLMENIVDSKGNKRFVEGTLTTNNISGVTYTYNKWSLSGTHLMLVINLTIAAGTSFGSLVIATGYSMPRYILDKINISGDTERQVCVKFADQWEDNNTSITPNFYCGLQKTVDNNKLQIATWGAKTFTNKTYIRIMFDVIIDNE